MWDGDILGGVRIGSKRACQDEKGKVRLSLASEGSGTPPWIPLFCGAY